MKSSSPATHHRQWRRSETAQREAGAAAAELAEVFEKLGALLCRWDELDAGEKERVTAIFVERFLPSLPPELLNAMEEFFEGRADWRDSADDAEEK